ncbi:MAG: hypothetical protein JSW11_00120 [Candidatus Heimdallarchaeota archaeon]|nr:MAG: hypothetical protein JSW11_00120 [Candidatus Heimdallarchaeota archaeon]
MFSEIVYVRKQESKEKNHDLVLDTNFLSEKAKDERINEDRLANQLADRALLLLSFKDTSTQNLRYVLNVLGIRTLVEKRNILQEIYRLIREGIIYVPRGLPLLIDQGSLFDTNNNSIEAEDIDICLLRPYEDLIKEIQNDIVQLQTNKTNKSQEI